MASNGGRKSFFFFGGGGDKRVNPSNDVGLGEFQESDLWDSGDVVVSDHGHSAKIISRKPSRKPARMPAGGNVTGSLPVNIPDWSRILGEEYRDHRRESNEDDVDAEDGDDEDDRRLPPHEYLARMRGTSFSVHEGVGRTLKGRDMSRVRNAVWKLSGFED